MTKPIGRAGSPIPASAKAQDVAKEAQATQPRELGHSSRDLFGELGDKLRQGAAKLWGVVEHAVWQVEEDVQARLSGRPDAEQIFLHHGLWAQKVSGGATAGVSLPSAQARLDAMLEDTPKALSHNPELGRAKSFEAVNGTLKLAPSSREAISKLQAPFDAMFGATVDALSDLRGGGLTPAGYMTRVMEDAALISSDWATSRGLPEAARNEAFARLVHFAFCAHRDDDSSAKLGSTDLKREAIGFGISDAGSLLEDTYRMTVAQQFSSPGKDAAHPLIDGNGVAGGFNYRIQDRQSGGSTITHHFGEFLGAGFVDLLGQSDRAVTQVDSPAKNPADVRNGYFAVMLGKGLASGELAPEDAVALTRWALTATPAGQTPPPWGAPEAGQEDGAFLSPGDFQLSAWLDAYRRAHP